MNIRLRRTGLRSVLLSLNCDRRYGYVLLALLGLLLLPALGGDSLRFAWRYERAGLAAGEFWRLLSAHGVHLDLAHAALNAAGLALMWVLFARDYAPSHWVLIAIASIVAIDAGLWLLEPQVEWYVGASGVLHGVMAAGTLARLRKRERDAWILAAFILCKLGYEQWQGSLPFSTDLRVVVEAHLYGAVGGALAAAAIGRSRESL